MTLRLSAILLLATLASAQTAREREIESHISIPRPPAQQSPYGILCQQYWASGVSPNQPPLCITSFRVLINAKILPAYGAPTTEQIETLRRGYSTGSLAWIYVPARGRYVVSLAAFPGSTPAGQVENDSLTFTLNGERVTISGREPIVPAGQSYPVYARRDPDWRPASKDAENLWSGTMPR